MTLLIIPQKDGAANEVLGNIRANFVKPCEIGIDSGGRPSETATNAEHTYINPKIFIMRVKG